MGSQHHVTSVSIHYYFPTKKELYLTVITKLRDLWKNEVEIMMSEVNAKEALSVYIRSLLDISFENPHAHKIWNREMMEGAKNLTPDIRRSMKNRNEREIELIKGWIKSGQIVEIEPQNLLYFLWSITTHFSDQRDQIKILNDNKYLNKTQREKVYEDAVNMVLRGILVE